VTNTISHKEFNRTALADETIETETLHAEPAALELEDDNESTRRVRHNILHCNKPRYNKIILPCNKGYLGRLDVL